MKAIELCTNRFDDDTKSSFVGLYTKVDAGATAKVSLKNKRLRQKAQQMESNDSEDEEDEEDLV